MIIDSDLLNSIYTSHTNGIQLTVHPPYEDPLPDHRGQAITSGTYTTIELAQVNLAALLLFYILSLNHVLKVSV